MITYLIFMLPALILGLFAQFRVKSAFSKYSKIRNGSGLTGAQAAQYMLRAAGLEGKVGIERVQGHLSDHYDPRDKVLRLSREVHDGASLAAVGVACHEAGHALQDARAYAPLVIRNAIVPTANFGSNFSFILIFIGAILAKPGLITLGIIFFSAVVIFQLVNLPVEFNASNRAKAMLSDLGIIHTQDEARGVASVLNAAAMTYVAATVSSIATLLYYLTIARD